MTNLKIETIKKNDFFFDESYQEYQSDYYKTNFIFKEIIIKDCKEEYHIPFTLHNKNSTKYISFLGEPLKMYVDKNLSAKKVFGIWKKFLKKTQIKDPKFNFFFKENEKNFTVEDLKKLKIAQTFKKQEIELDKKISEIFNLFKPNLKNEIRKIKKNKSFIVKIYDHTNYVDKKILDMKKMHYFVAKKKTRSDKCWDLNEKFIKKKKGFLVEILYKKKPISYSFFANDINKSIYFSSVTDRNYFKLAGVNHLSLWKAIIYSKYKKIKKLELGITKYCYNRDLDKVTKKDENIAFFKSRFNGKEDFFISIDEKSKI
jgi:hypothetical protein